MQTTPVEHLTVESGQLIVLNTDVPYPAAQKFAAQVRKKFPSSTVVLLRPGASISILSHAQMNALGWYFRGATDGE
jgi:hypothetical protein